MLAHPVVTAGSDNIYQLLSAKKADAFSVVPRSPSNTSRNFINENMLVSNVRPALSSQYYNKSTFPSLFASLPSVHRRKEANFDQRRNPQKTLTFNGTNKSCNTEVDSSVRSNEASNHVIKTSTNQIIKEKKKIESRMNSAVRIQKNDNSNKRSEKFPVRDANGSRNETELASNRQKLLRSTSVRNLTANNDHKVEKQRAGLFSNQSNQFNKPNRQAMQYSLTRKKSGGLPKRPVTSFNHTRHYRSFDACQIPNRHISYNSKQRPKSSVIEARLSFIHQIPEPAKQKLLRPKTSLHISQSHKPTVIRFDHPTPLNFKITDCKEKNQKTSNSSHSLEITRDTKQILTESSNKNPSNETAEIKDFKSSQTENSTDKNTPSGEDDFNLGLKKLRRLDEMADLRSTDLLSSEQLVMRESIEKVQKWIKSLPRHFDAIHHVLPAVQQDY